MNGGTIIGEVLRKHGVEFIFTLCGGHISPILVGSDKAGIKVVDVRDEKNAVFAADAVARMTGVPGVAAVTAGPGLTNTITAIKNAQMAQSPLIVFGGATATVLKGRGFTAGYRPNELDGSPREMGHHAQIRQRHCSNLGASFSYCASRCTGSRIHRSAGGLTLRRSDGS